MVKGKGLDPRDIWGLQRDCGDCGVEAHFMRNVNFNASCILFP